MNFLRDTTVLILGLGDSGLAMARWCVRHGAQVSVWDSRQVAPQDHTLAQELPAVQRLTSLPLPPRERELPSVVGLTSLPLPPRERELPGVVGLTSLPLPPRERAGVRVNGDGAADTVAATNGAGPVTPSLHPHPNPLPERERGQEDFQLILKSPGLSPQDVRIAPLLQQARARGVAVLGELDLFARALADLKAERGYAPQLLAITGTNGKTTVTAMTALLVARAGKAVAMAGNIGPTLLDTLQAQLDAVPPEPAEAATAAEHHNDADSAEELAEQSRQLQEPEQREQPEQPEQADQPDQPQPPQLPQVWVLELSSFQLEGGGTGVQGFEPAAATVLNLTQDHLDWHGDMAAYTAAKARVFGRQAVMVINRDDATVVALVPVPTAVKTKGARAAVKPVQRQVLAFGMGLPVHPGDFGIVEEGGMAWLVRALPADETFKRKKGDPEEDIHLQRLMPADALRVRGRHNAANALAALALATAIGCPLAPMLHGLRDYRGEPHRVQFVQRVDGVDAYDDSKGTNVGATVAALTGLGTDQAPGRLVVILGGDGKGQDFSPLVQPLARHARAVATIGRDAGRIEEALAAHAQTAALPVQRFASLQEATAWCMSQARNGDAVLLSPACASLDMFDNYAHRARVFVDAVQAWAADRGQA